jgi:hypothetical protein
MTAWPNASPAAWASSVCGIQKAPNRATNPLFGSAYLLFESRHPGLAVKPCARETIAAASIR